MSAPPSNTVEGIAALIAEAAGPSMAAAIQPPFVIGLCGAQGSGKSTVSRALASRLEAANRRVAILSLDDLYLPREDRAALVGVHPLLKTRGPPGTHDVALGVDILEALGRPGRVALPRFDKGRDTRLSERDWTDIAAPVDVVVFEGWCVGARPQTPDALAAPVNDLEREEDPQGLWRAWVNDRLASDYQRLFERLDWLALLAASDFAVVAGWRRQQERELREARPNLPAQAPHALRDDEVDRFVAHYQRLTDHILREMPARADLVLHLDGERRVVRSQVK